MDRRSLLKTAAGLTVAAALPAATVAAAAEIPAPAIAVVTPVKLKPYADYVWEWFVSNDGEVYHESFPTKEEALAYAKQCDYAVVAECKPQDFNLSVDGDWVIEHLNEANYMEIGEGDGIDCSTAQCTDLGLMVTQAIEAWAVKHSIDIRAWSFGGMKNETRVEPQATYPI